MARTTYKHIEQDMRSRITAGMWPVGTLLPSRRALAREYDVAGLTVQRAIACLTEDGTLRVQPRKGTIVAPKPGVVRRSDVVNSATTQRSHVKPVRLGIVAELPAFGSLSIDGSYFETRIAVQAIEGIFSEQDISTRFMNLLQSDGQILPVEKAIETLAEHNIDGIVIAFNDEPDKARRAFAASKRTGTPLVYVSSRELDVPLPHVFFDNVDAGYQAAQHLLSQGCDTLTMIAPFDEDWVQQRARGIRHALIAAGLTEQEFSLWPPEPGPAPWGAGIAYNDNKRITQAAAFEQSQSLFRTGPVPKAIIAANDHVAFAILHAAERVGLRAGKDFILVGFDDVPDARIVGLSTIRPPLESMGQEAANMLLEATYGSPKRQQVKLRSRLVTRMSSTKIAHDLLVIGSGNGQGVPHDAMLNVRASTT